MERPASRPAPRCADGASESTEPAALLAALDDPDCRTILAATGDRALTAAELCEACDLAESTAYRKLDQLVEVGLLTESLRLRKGYQASEYRRAVETIRLTLDDGVSLTFDAGPTRSPPSDAAAD